MGENETLSPEIADYVRQIEAVRQDVRALVPGLTPEQLRWRSSPNAWSVLECIAHLNETARQYAPVIHAAIDRARASEWFGRGPFHYGLLERWFVRLMEPPPKFRVRRTPFPPDLSGPPDAVLSEFDQLHSELAGYVRTAIGIDLARTKVESPASRSLKLSLGQVFALLAAHGRRHIWQAKQVLAAPGFPAPH